MEGIKAYIYNGKIEELEQVDTIAYEYIGTIISAKIMDEDIKNVVTKANNIYYQI